jgi:PAS domain S-box-containing protein
LPRGLGAQLALAFCLLSVVLTTALVALFERRAMAQLETQIGQGLADLAAQTSDKLERGMFERYREVALIAARSAMTDPAYSDARRAQALARVQQSYSYYEWLGIANVDGNVLASGNNLLIGADVSARPWFRGGLLGGFVGDVHEAVLLAKLLPSQPGARRFVDVAFPFADASGKVRGVLGAHLSWNWAREVERSVLGAAHRGGRLETLILSSDGLVLLGPAELMDKKLSLESFRRASPTPLGDYLVERWPDGRRYLVGFQKGTGYANYPGLGWVVMVRQDLDDAYAPVRAMRIQVLLGGLALAMLCSLVGLWVAGRITRPLQQLATSAGEISDGGDVHIEPGRGGYEEVRALSRSLNALVSDLDERRRQLQQLNGTLEEVVEARTAELRNALDTVRVSEARIRAIVETAQDAFIGVDLDGRIIEWNQQAELLLGWRRDEIVGKRLANLMLPEWFRPQASDAALPFIAGVQEGAFGRREERIMTDRYGAEIPVEMSSGLAGQGENATFSIFLRDITERKRIDSMKNEFVGTVSHELRTPLSSIRASLGLLADGVLGPLPPDMLELVEICNKNCIRLNRLVDDMLDIEKIEAGMMSFAPKRQPVLPVAREAVRTMRGMANAAGVDLILDSGPDAANVEASFDYDRMTQVLTNLLSNAIKVAPRGSPVLLQIVDQPQGARLSVCDRGPGIPEAQRERVFKPFVQLGPKEGGAATGGTGLGLAICKRIIDEHGGEIAIADTPGGGTVFHITLPHGAAAVPGEV